MGKYQIFSKRVKIHYFILAASILFLTSYLTSCTNTMSAVEHKNLETSAKMSNTIFLNPVSPEHKTIFVQVKNTSDAPINFQNLIIQKLEAKGYKVVHDPYKAHYWLQSNVLYVGVEKKHLTATGALVGGFGGGLIGSAFGSGRGKIATTGAGALIGSGLGMLAGAAIHVDKYMGVVDIQVKEKVRKGTVQAQTQSNMQQGIGTAYSSTHKSTSQYKAYRTRIAVEATRTNLNLAEAIPVLDDKLSSETAGIF